MTTVWLWVLVPVDVIALVVAVAVLFRLAEREERRAGDESAS